MRKGTEQNVLLAIFIKIKSYAHMGMHTGLGLERDNSITSDSSWAVELGDERICHLLLFFILYSLYFYYNHLLLL